MQICAQHYEVNGAAKKDGSTSSWSQTIAPGGGNGYGTYYYLSKTVNDSLSKDTGDLIQPEALSKWDVKTPFSFLPGWALTWHLKHNYNAPPNWINGISIGVDCVGLVQRAASYSDNKYEYPDIAGQNIYNSAHESTKKDVYTARYESWYSETRSHTYEPDYRHLIVKSGEKKEKIDNIYTLEKAILLVPGDIFQQYKQVDGNWAGTHIGIIQSINDANGDREIELGEVQIIESTWGAGIAWAHVTNEQTLANYKRALWYINRLK